MELNLDGKRALVTGSSKGLGLAAARALLEEGAAVAINARGQERLKQALQELKKISGTVLALQGDVADQAAPERLVETAAAEFGGLDILITNAGGPPAGSFESFSDSMWDNAVELSFLSHTRLIRSALPHLRRSAAASILTVTSFTVQQPLKDLVLSNSVRSATTGLTRSLAAELGGDGVRVNSILPGWTRTERVSELMQARADANGTTAAEEAARLSEQIPLGRMAEPEEFARAAAFLVSPAASYITGVLLLVDGGVVLGSA